jgi:hypothetical protein
MGAAGRLTLSVKDRGKLPAIVGSFPAYERLHFEPNRRQASRGAQISVRVYARKSMMNKIPEHIQGPLQRLIDGGLSVDEIAIMMQLSEEAVKEEVERTVATSTSRGDRTKRKKRTIEGTL